MKSLCVICASAALAFAAPAFADNKPISPVNPGIFHGALTPDCGTGFTKGPVQGSPTAETYSWTCSTATITCPNPPAGKNGGLLDPKAVTTAGGVQFSYACTYRTMPK